MDDKRKLFESKAKNSDKSKSDELWYRKWSFWFQVGLGSATGVASFIHEYPTLRKNWNEFCDNNDTSKVMQYAGIGAAGGTAMKIFPAAKAATAAGTAAKVGLLAKVAAAAKGVAAITIGAHPVATVVVISGVVIGGLIASGPSNEQLDMEKMKLARQDKAKYLARTERIRENMLYASLLCDRVKMMQNKEATQQKIAAHKNFASFLVREKVAQLIKINDKLIEEDKAFKERYDRQWGFAFTPNTSEADEQMKSGLEKLAIGLRVYDPGSLVSVATSQTNIAGKRWHNEIEYFPACHICNKANLASIAQRNAQHWAQLKLNRLNIEAAKTTA